MQPWAEILLRSIFMFFLTLILVRVMGKKQPTKMTPFQFVNYAIIAILVALISANIITNFVFGILALAVWSLFAIGLDYLSLKSKWMHDWINGREIVLVKDGKVMEENLKQVRFTGEDLLRELRSRNAFNLADVEFAIMEHTGDVNVILKADKKPITPHDLGQKVAPQDAPQTVIMDGNILHECLTNLGLNEGWLRAQLKNAGVALENVFIAQVDSSGDVYFDLFDDLIQPPQPQVKEMLYANIEKAQADLTTYFYETQDPKAKEMYERNAAKLKELMNKIEPYLLR